MAESKTLYETKNGLKSAEKLGKRNEIEEEGIVRFTPFIELPDGRLCEQGYDGTKVYYIIYDPKTGGVTKEDYIKIGGVAYLPVDNDDVRNEIVLLPSDAQDYGTDDQLAKEIRDFLDYWHEELDELERTIDVAYVFVTYLKDLLPQIPYRRCLGGWGRGKTTSNEVAGAISYRPMFLAGCSSEASLRRTFDMWRGTAVIDEADFSAKTDLYSALVKMLNIGYDAKNGFYRCCDENDPKNILSFNVFGPKYLGTRQRYNDVALESRCLTKIAQANVSPKPLYRWTKFKEQAQVLRNKLLMWRFRHYHEIKAKIAEVLEDPNIIEKIYGEKIGAESRVCQIVVPLSLVSGGEFREVLKLAAIQHSEVLRALDEDRQLEEQVNAALYDILSDQRVTQVTVVTEHREGGGGDAVAATSLEKENQERTFDSVTHKVTRDEDLWRPVKIPLREIGKRILGEGPSDLAERKEYVGELKGLTRKIGKMFKNKHLIVKRGAKNLSEVYLPPREIRRVLAWGASHTTVTKVTSVTQGGEGGPELSPASPKVEPLGKDAENASDAIGRTKSDVTNVTSGTAGPGETPTPTVSDIERRLYEIFGVNPFKPSQLLQHFSADELAKLNVVIDEMLKRGRLVKVPLESGGWAFRLVVKNG